MLSSYYPEPKKPKILLNRKAPEELPGAYMNCFIWQFIPLQLLHYF